MTRYRYFIFFRSSPNLFCLLRSKPKGNERLLKLAKDLRELVPRVKRAFELLIPFPEEDKEDTEELPPESPEPLSQEEQELLEEFRRDLPVELPPEVHDEMLHFAEFLERFQVPILDATVLGEKAGLHLYLIAAVKFVQASTGRERVLQDLANVIVVLEDSPDSNPIKKAEAIRGLMRRWDSDHKRLKDLRLRTRFRREGDDEEDDHGNDQRDDADLRPRPPLIEDEDAGDEDNDDEDGGTQTFEISRSDFTYLTDDEIADLVKRSKARWAKYWSGDSSSLPKEPDGTHQ